MLITFIALCTFSALSGLFYKRFRWLKKLVTTELSAVLFAVLLAYPVYAAHSDAYSYTISIDELEKTKLQEQTQYGEVKTADTNQQLPFLNVLLLVGVGWLINRIYLKRQEEKYGGENEPTKARNKQ